MPYRLRRLVEDSLIRRDVQRILQTVDLQAFENVRKTHRDHIKKKFLDIEFHLSVALTKTFELGLRSGPPRTILDLGTGCGYFPFVCGYFGHNVLGLDVEGDPLYDEMIELLGVKRRIWTIHAYDPMPDLGATFDLVTGFMVCFNRVNHPDLWGVSEWDFFLRDLACKHLSKEGRIFFVLNKHAPTDSWFDDQLLRYFLDKGARVDLGEVYFPSVDLLREPAAKSPQ